MDDHPDLSTLKAVLAVLFVFHAAVIAVVFVVAWSQEAGAYAAVAGWPWLILGAIGVSGPVVFRWRLMRVRARRAQLLQSEWMMHEEPSHRGREPRSSS